MQGAAAAAARSEHEVGGWTGDVAGVNRNRGADMERVMRLFRERREATVLVMLVVVFVVLSSPASSS